VLRLRLLVIHHSRNRTGGSSYPDEQSQGSAGGWSNDSIADVPAVSEAKESELTRMMDMPSFQQFSFGRASRRDYTVRKSFS